MILYKVINYNNGKELPKLSKHLQTHSHQLIAPKVKRTIMYDEYYIEDVSVEQTLTVKGELGKLLVTIWVIPL